MTAQTPADIQTAIRDRYGALAQSLPRGTGTCCGAAESPRDAAATDGPAACCGGAAGDPITSNLYSDGDTRDLPPAAVAASLGCGNPTALLSLEQGQTVLDLGSGGGIDVLLSAKRVGPAGKVYGLDMTDEMLALARDNQRKAGATNVEFLKGTIEAIPLPADSVDVIISNCVINLSTDKDAVLREAFRVLKPGGRLAVSDIIVRGTMPSAVRQDMELWIGCVAGALEEREYASKLKAAGFADVDVDVWRVYDTAALAAQSGQAGGDAQPSDGSEANGQFASAFIRATKPARGCCGPDCCA